MRSSILLTLLLVSITTFSQTYDIMIINGRILDGSGNSWFRGDVGIKDGKIIKVGNLRGATSATTIDAGNKIVSPGFIDVHTHIEGEEFRNPTANNFIHDGVTTVITGNCGSSNVDIRRYLQRIDSLQPSVNVATLIGHNDVRKTIMGTANRRATDDELKQMEGIVAKAMIDGAVGFSTGLIYIPGTYSNSEEVIKLAGAAARYNGIYATHMRNEGDSVVPAIKEALLIGKSNNMPVQISHFKLSGQHNWGRSKETLGLIAKAREEGIDVTIDQYPYTASSTSLSTLIPEDVLADGQDSIRARLQKPEVRAYVERAMLKSLKKRKLKHFSYAVVASYRADSTFNGKSIEEINKMMGRKHRAKEEAHTVMDMMIKGGASMVFHGMGDEDVERIMQYPYNMFASDASIRIMNQGVPHPRGYGTNARVLSKYVRDEKVITLEDAVRRMTSLPAQKFQLYDRGLLREGFAADIVIFDEKQVRDLSTYEQPHAYSKGFDYVIVNGNIVVKDGEHLGTRSGKPIYGPATNLKL